MARKDLRSVQTNLAALADTLPTQHVARAEPTATPFVTRGAASSEEVIQFSLSLRKSLRKELARLADDTDMTMRAFVLMALRDKGLSVTDEDLLDLRKERPKVIGRASQR
jgi:hypothetical protein